MDADAKYEFTGIKNAIERMAPQDVLNLDDVANGLTDIGEFSKRSAEALEALVETYDANDAMAERQTVALESIAKALDVVAVQQAWNFVAANYESKSCEAVKEKVDVISRSFVKYASER